MITDLRQHQRGSSSPFYFVLLAPAHNGTNGSLPLIQGWQSQLTALTLPNTAIANTIDLGDVSPLINELHPRNKSLIGQRLARIALNNLYGQTQVIRGPTLANISTAVRVHRVDGSRLSVSMQYPATAESSLLHVMGTAECESCCDGVSSALFGLTVVDGGGGAGSGTGVSSGSGSSGSRIRSGGSDRSEQSSAATIYWPAHVDIDVEHRLLQAVVSVPSLSSSGAAATRVRIDFENAVSYPECALYNEANLPALPFSVEVEVGKAVESQQHDSAASISHE